MISINLAIMMKENFPMYVVNVYPGTQPESHMQMFAHLYALFKLNKQLRTFIHLKHAKNIKMRLWKQRARVRAQELLINFQSLSAALQHASSWNVTSGYLYLPVLPQHVNTSLHSRWIQQLPAPLLCNKIYLNTFNARVHPIVSNLLTYEPFLLDLKTNSFEQNHQLLCGQLQWNRRRSTWLIDYGVWWPKSWSAWDRLWFWGRSAALRFQSFSDSNDCRYISIRTKGNRDVLWGCFFYYTHFNKLSSDIDSVPVINEIDLSSGQQLISRINLCIIRVMTRIN